MKKGLLGFITKAITSENPLHPVDQQMAKHYIKDRLAFIFPELRADPIALEEAYRSLALEPQAGTEVGDAATYYEVRVAGNE